MSRLYTLNDVMGMEVRCYALSPRFRAFLGSVPLGESVSMLVSGPPGSGKSSFLLQVADEFARFGPVLYCTSEEKVQAGGIRFRALAQNIRHKQSIFIAECTEIDQLRRLIQTGEYIMVIVDSVQKMRRLRRRLRSSEVMSITGEHERPIFTVFVSQTTKDRKTAAGEASDAHDVDVEVFTTGEHDEPRYARIDKSRLNPSVLTYHIFTPKAHADTRPTMPAQAQGASWPEIQQQEREKRMRKFLNKGTLE